MSTRVTLPPFGNPHTHINFCPASMITIWNIRRFIDKILLFLTIGFILAAKEVDCRKFCRKIEVSPECRPRKE